MYFGFDVVWGAMFRGFDPPPDNPLL